MLRSLTGLTEVVASYHFSVVKVLFLKRAAFYSRHTNLSRVLTDESADALRIGSSDCKTNRFVSLTRDCFSVVNDLPWGTRSELNVLAKFDYIRLPDFVKVNPVLVRQLNLKKCKLRVFNPFLACRPEPATRYSGRRIPDHRQRVSHAPGA
jgi:hypothetical protein